MKKIIKYITSVLLIALFFSFCNRIALAQNEKIADNFLLEKTGISALNYVQVSESVVMVHNDKLQGSNIICVALDDGLVFFDCSLFTDIGLEFRRVMEKKYDRKTLALVQSHAHSDHFFGMDAFNDVPYIASAKSKRMFEAQLAIDFEKYKEGYMNVFPLFDKAIETAKLRLPSLWFEKEYELGSGDSKLILRDAGGHTEGSIYAYFEKEKVILVGDDVQVGYYPYFGDQTGSLIDWMDVLRAWEKMEIDYVCAGHGPVTDKTYISKTRGFFENLVAKLKELKACDAAIEEVLTEVNALEQYWPKSLEKPGWYDYSIKMVYSKI